MRPRLALKLGVKKEMFAPKETECHLFSHNVVKTITCKNGIEMQTDEEMVTTVPL